MKRTIRANSGHTLHIASISQEEALAQNLPFSEQYTDYYIVRNWDATGTTFFFMAKGNPNAPKQIVVWYANTKSMWSSFGTSFETAINGAQADGWMHA